MNSCLTCKWAEWVMTAHATPRIKMRSPGRCTYPMSRVALPMCMRFDAGKRELTDNDKRPLFPTNPNVNCRVWEKSAESAS